MSRIITFYSYKGGVGRTLALANIGILLAKRNKRVLLMDWDLEAPGLDRYFYPHQRQEPYPEQGIMQLLACATTDPNEDWRNHVQRVNVRPQGDKQDCTLSFIPSGVAAPDYADQVRSFSWPEFLGEHDGGIILERWRGEWKQEFDFILIDSRTGITDTGGICTILLPDFMVLVFTANEQSFQGALAVEESAQIERRNLSVPRPPLMILPLLSRFDRRDEIDEADVWLERFSSGLKSIYADWLPKQFEPLQILELTKVPYVTRFSFGEPLPVLTHNLTDPDLLGFYLENCTRLLASDFREATRIIDPSIQEPHDGAEQVRSLIQRAPIKEQDLLRLLRLVEMELGEGTELASLLNDVGSALYSQARFALAGPYYWRALEIAKKVLGPEHPSVATSLNNLALLYNDQGRYTDAEPLFQRALAIREKVLDPEHPDVANSLNNLALLYYAQGRYTEAEPLYKR
ncbi:MAG: tetratricopeptide repeat protein, partial [Gammaproteobacteria bacterium]|nr:tetratricopeptide repeat protein [Gammaproteobacteria bacterium]